LAKARSRATKNDDLGWVPAPVCECFGS
jgi:hypothetical protein